MLLLTVCKPMKGKTVRQGAMGNFQSLKLLSSIRIFFTKNAKLEVLRELIKAKIRL